MSIRSRSLGSLTLVGLLLVLTQLPAAAAETSGTIKQSWLNGCTVWNKRTDRSTDSLRGAVNKARPHDVLIVSGTCRETVTIDKPLAIGGITVHINRPLPLHHLTLKPKLHSRSGRAALIIDPSVDDLSVGIGIRGGVVIDDPATARRRLPEVPMWRWRQPPTFDRSCIINEAPGRLDEAVSGSTAGASWVFRGRCRGTLEIGVPMTIRGSRKATTRAGGGIIDSGVPLHPDRIVVDPSVDRLVLAAFRILDGFYIRDGAPSQGSSGA